MATIDPCDFDLVEIGRRIQARELSSLTVTRAILDRIVRLDRRLKSYATVTADSRLRGFEEGVQLAPNWRRSAQIAFCVARRKLRGPRGRQVGASVSWEPKRRLHDDCLSGQ